MEVAGLVLGGVALASLYSACRDLLEVFELSRNSASDYELATTKLILLKTRLRLWGDAGKVEQPGKEAEELRKHWADEGIAIMRSLSGINTILSNAANLSETYGLGAQKKPLAEYLNPRSSPVVRAIRQQFDSHLQQHKKVLSIRRRAVWAIYDKKKFDGLIADLDFLLTNLEKVSIRLSIPTVVQQPLHRPQTLHSSPHSQNLLDTAMSTITTTMNPEAFRGPGHRVDGKEALSSEGDASAGGKASDNGRGHDEVNTSYGNKTTENGRNITGNFVPKSSARNVSIGNDTAGSAINFTGQGSKNTLKQLLALDRSQNGKKRSQ